MLIFFDFSDNQKQSDYAHQRGGLPKSAHNPIFEVPNGTLKGCDFSNDATANTQTNRVTEALFD